MNQTSKLVARIQQLEERVEVLENPLQEVAQPTALPRNEVLKEVAAILKKVEISVDLGNELLRGLRTWQVSEGPTKEDFDAKTAPEA